MLEGGHVSARRRWWLIGAAAGLALVALALLLVFRQDLGTWYVARTLRAASTPEQERAACARMNRWAHALAHGYSVEAEDASGTPFRPWETGDYDRVAVVIITWDNGTKVRRSLLDKGSLVSLFGE